VSQRPPVPARSRAPERNYVALLGLIIACVTVTLTLSKAYYGWYPRPALFGLFRLLDSLCFALLTVTFIAVAVQFGRRWDSAAARAALVLPGVVCAVWLVVWAVVHALFGIRLSVGQVWDLVSEPHSIQLVGLSRASVLGACSALVLVALALAAVIQAAARASGPRFTRRTLLLVFGGFLSLHLAVRSYFAYHIARNQRAVLALDEGTPLALRTETLIPGLSLRRVQFPSLEDPARTDSYLAWASHGPQEELRNKPSILLVSVESLRADALNDSTTPYLWSHRNEFQLRLGRDHWTGGNATRSGTFSMLTGLAAFHMQRLRGAGIAFPLLTLLDGNGYRLRIAKGLSFYYGNLRAFLPAQAVVAEVSAPSRPSGDRAMVDSLLQDLGRRNPARPAFDLLTFDATHWPYDDPERYRTTGPAKRPERIYRRVRSLRSPETMRLARLHYDNSVRFIDRELGQVIERLRSTGALNHTIVIVTGDHGEEFLERGQLGHSSGMNDFQGRVPLWVHFPGPVVPPEQEGLSSNLDLVPTLLDYLGLERDVLLTQGRSLLRTGPPRSLLMLAEQGWAEPAYHALVSPTYMSRWRSSGRRFLFSSVERRDGTPVAGDAWWREVQAGRPQAALGYEVLPDVRVGAPPFQGLQAAEREQR
jgi:membrane-anchored protein YejM (alkaline phosphatase superfamily)